MEAECAILFEIASEIRKIIKLEMPPESGRNSGFRPNGNWLIQIEPGPAGALLQDNRVACELICDGIHLHKAVVDIAVRLKGVGGSS